MVEHSVKMLACEEKATTTMNSGRTRSFTGADIGSDHDLLMMTFRLRLKKKSASRNTQDSTLTSKS